MLRYTPLISSSSFLRRVAFTSSASSSLMMKQNATTSSSPFNFSQIRTKVQEDPSVNVVEETLSPDATEDIGTEGSDPRAAAFLGIFGIASGIILINLNERRAAKQDMLDDTIEPLVVSLTDTPAPESKTKVKRFDSAEELDGLIFHAYGEVKATEPWARDVDLGIHAPNALRLKRHVEMYQYVEHKEEHKDKNGNKTTHYSYSKEWRSHHQHTRDGRNPTFPHYSDIMEARELNMSIPNRPKDPEFDRPSLIKLLLSRNFVRRIQEWEPITQLQSNDDWMSLRNRGMKLLPSGDKLYSANGGEEYDPRIGDVKITYQSVPEGEYTSLGYYSAKKGMKPVKGKLKETLAKSHGDLIIPEKANEIVNQATQATGGYDPLDLKLTKQQEVKSIDKETGKEVTEKKSILVLPDYLVEGLESMMLKSTPIEFAFLRREHATKKVAFEHNREDQASVTDKWWYIGLLCTGLGGAAIGSATSILLPAAMSNATAVGGLSTGLLIGRQTREGARAQVEAERKKNPDSKAIRSAKSKSVFEL